ncbi:MAG: hypothetical protein O3B41_10800 [Bacteroidetes bacterium]|nr:hypothetical protein [Bacteroidota bacterium]
MNDSFGAAGSQAITPPLKFWTLLIFGLLFFAGCDSVATNDQGSSRQRDSVVFESKVSERATQVQDSLTTAILSHEEIVGLASSVSEFGVETIIVLVKTPINVWPPQKRNIVPLEAGGIPVIVIVTGEISAPISAQGAGTMLGAQVFSRPVPIGVSAGIANGLTGTLGARVTDGTLTYALSNNHVFASMNNGTVGSSIIQPGRFDGGTELDHTFANLSDFEPIDFSGQCVNTIDAAIAETGVDQLTNATPEVGYGIPWKTPLAATAGMNVQKFGRTSGLTFGSVLALNATVEVSYGNAGIACFKNQIIVSPGEFSLGGDSGSLVVASSNDEAIDTRPVGLVFAGSSTISVANDIRLVLDRFGITVDGRDGPTPGNNGSGNSNNRGNGNGNSNQGGNGNGVGNGNYDADAQFTGELYLRVVNSSNQFVSHTICVYTSAASSNCSSSSTEEIDSSTDYNWGAQIAGNPCSACQESLGTDTQYLIMTTNSTNGLFLYYELGDVDGFATLTIGSGTDEFSNAWTNHSSYDLDVVSAVVSNVSVGTPNWNGYENSITWDARWSGTEDLNFFPRTASVKINGGATLSSGATHSNGSGAYSWSPSQLYSGIQIQVVDNGSGSSSLSSTFSVVDRPAEASIEGPSSLDIHVQGTWTASAVGGETPYGYIWEYMWICGAQGIGIQVEECNTWNGGGTSSSFSKTASGDNFDLKIKLIVTESSSSTVQDTVYLTVDIIDP